MSGTRFLSSSQEKETIVFIQPCVLFSFIMPVEAVNENLALKRREGKVLITENVNQFRTLFRKT